MNTPVPFCEECGVLGVILSGMHPADEGIVQWALYQCGHVRTEIVLEEELLDLSEVPHGAPRAD